MNDTEFRDLLGTHMSEVSKKWMENGRLKELSEEEGKREFYEEIYRPFKHNLFLRFFGDTAEGQHYRIDSIQWQMRTMMELVNGDTLQFHTLLPGAGQEDKPYVVVKKLADIVVASGQFR